MMVFYHFMYNLAFLGITRVAFTPPLQAPFAAFQLVTAGLFISLVGVSLSISDSRYLRENGRRSPFSRTLKRGLRILAWGMVITVVTRFAVGPFYVRFGILHCIGLSIILAYPFLPHRRLTLSAALLAIVLGIWLRGQTFGFPWLMWLGLKPTGQEYVDYIPLLPWFGVALLGVFAGSTLYPNGLRSYRLPDWGGRWPVRGLALMGRHSLAIYLLHQPVLILLMALVRPGIWSSLFR